MRCLKRPDIDQVTINLGQCFAMRRQKKKNEGLQHAVWAVTNRNTLCVFVATIGYACRYSLLFAYSKWLIANSSWIDASQSHYRLFGYPVSIST